VTYEGQLAQKRSGFVTRSRARRGHLFENQRKERKKKIERKEYQTGRKRSSSLRIERSVPRKKEKGKPH